MEKATSSIKNKVKSKKELEKKIISDLAFFKSIGDKIKREMGEVDVVKIIREERDRDNA